MLCLINGGKSIAKLKEADRHMLVDKEQIKMYDDGAPNQTAQDIFKEYGDNPHKTREKIFVVSKII